jgi:transmembrane sensor
MEKSNKFTRVFKREDRRWKAMLKVEYEEMLQSGRSILPSEKSAQLLQQLHDKIISRQQIVPRKSIVWIRYAAAASVLLIAGASWYHHHTAYTHDAVMPVAAVTKTTLIVQSNNSDSVCSLVLSDHSVVKLSQGSSISYYPSFDTGKRDISLSGKAIFEVTKNIARPFTVYAGNISTTVLGTRFMMSTLEQHKVRVKLFEGKVLIRSVAGTFGIQNVYLNAGEQFIIDNHLKQFSVTAFNDNAGKISKVITSTETEISDTTLEFNQEPLSKVLTRIGKRYKVQFTLRGDNFNNMLVTGKLLPSDSLTVVLSMLGNINRLSFKVDSNKIEVARIQ